MKNVNKWIRFIFYTVSIFEISLIISTPFYDTVFSLEEKRIISPELLNVEISETASPKDEERMSLNIGNMQKNGFRFSLDDSRTRIIHDQYVKKIS